MTGSTPMRDERPIFDWLFAVAAAAVVAAFVRVFYFTPIEAAQGAAQKIYYVHIGSASAAYLGFTITGLGSVVYLWLRDERSDRLAASAAEVGLLFITIVLLTGPLWGKPIWGAYWTWDARQTLTLFLWFLIAAYLVLRSTIDEPMQRGRYSAVLAILAVILIPFNHLAVYMFRTQHPEPIVFKPSEPSLPPEMLTSFLIMLFALLFFCVVLIRARYRLAVTQEIAEGTT
jgi:heme exporter protein C